MLPHGAVPSLLYPPVIVLLREQVNCGKEAWRWQDHLYPGALPLATAVARLPDVDRTLWMLPAFLVTIWRSLTFLAQGSYSS